MKKSVSGLCVAILLLGLGGCIDEEPMELPPPAKLTYEAIGYYCAMTVSEHAGPKGQIWLSSRDEPLWFSSVRDTLAFTLLPGEPKDIRAIYVTDMSNSDAWEQSASVRWIEARGAVFVAGGKRAGGMGAAEHVPFSDRAAAEAFVLQYGGRIIGYSEISEAAILAPVEVSNMPGALEK